MLDAGKKLLALFSTGGNCVADLFVRNRIKVSETQVFELAANFAHAKPVGDGTVNVQSLLRDFLLAIGRQMLERAHIVQAVGELDEDDPDVVHHS